MKLPLWATVLTLLGIGILLSLSVWQLKRMQWKQGILDRLEESYALAQQAPSLNLAALEPLQFGNVEGSFLSDKAFLVGPKTKNGEVGHEVIVPLKTKDKTLLLNLGWTGEEDIQTLPIHHAQGQRVAFSGLIMEPSRNTFSSNNAPAQEIWITIAPQEMAAAHDLGETYPFYMRVETASLKFDAAFPNNERWYPRNKHAQYAAFWFVMAAALAGVYIFRFIRK